MATTDEETSATGPAGHPERDAVSKSSGGVGGGTPSPGIRMARRYGPFVVVAILLTAVVVVFRGGGGDDGPEGPAPEEVDAEALIRSGPMTPEKAELLGEEVDFGSGCDLATGRIKIPHAYAPPCVEPFDGDNGGATSPGVTGVTIKIVAYIPRDDFVTSALADAEISLDPEPTIETLQGFVDLYNQTFETYGRKVELVTYQGTGSSSDQELAKADAIAIADMEPFAVVGGPPLASETFADELSARDIVCLQGCALGLSEDFVQERTPYVWPDGLTGTQAGLLTAEVVGGLAGPGPAQMAGDRNLQEQERVYGVIHPEREGGRETLDALEDGLGDYGIDIEVTVENALEPTRAQEAARNIIVQMENAGVTTVIYTGDMLSPTWLTREATAQDYHPEWILGPNYFADTAAFGRTYDRGQWVNGFGLAFKTTASSSAGQAGGVYEWAYGEEPPSPITGAIEPAVRTLFTGVHLAGPELTPGAFRDGLFRYPPSGDARTSSTMSWGDHGIWPGIDYGETDDVALVWWDPEASDQEATNIAGEGLYRLANGGQRYSLGQFPSSPEEAGLFDTPSSVLMYSVPLPDEQARDYPPPSV